MIAPVFVDTSAWYSLCDRSDAHHARSAAFFREATQPFATSNLVFAETLSLVTKRLGKAAALRFGHGLRASRRARILHVDARMEEAAWETFAGYSDKGWDLIDCASFVLMESLKATTAFTYDSHFSQRGFAVLPR